MKDPTQSMLKELETSRGRLLELERKLAELPTDSGPEIVMLYGNLLAKEKKFQARMTAALTPAPVQKKVPKFRITLAVLVVIYLLYWIVLT